MMKPMHITLSTLSVAGLLAMIPHVAMSTDGAGQALPATHTVAQTLDDNAMSIWEMELELEEDLDGDGYIGPPPPPPSGGDGG